MYGMGFQFSWKASNCFFFIKVLHKTFILLLYRLKIQRLTGSGVCCLNQLAVSLPNILSDPNYDEEEDVITYKLIKV